MISFFGTCTCFERRDTIVEQAFEALVQNLHLETSTIEVERSIDDCGRTKAFEQLKIDESSGNAIPHLFSLTVCFINIVKPSRRLLGGKTRCI